MKSAATNGAKHKKPVENACFFIDEEKEKEDYSYCNLAVITRIRCTSASHWKQTRPHFCTSNALSLLLFLDVAYYSLLCVSMCQLKIKEGGGGGGTQQPRNALLWSELYPNRRRC